MHDSLGWQTGCLPTIPEILLGVPRYAVSECAPMGHELLYENKKIIGESTVRKKKTVLPVKDR